MSDNQTNCVCRHDTGVHYTCGCCGVSFSAICLLHLHLEDHTANAYHYSYRSHTAFPKFDTVCMHVQTGLHETVKPEASGATTTSQDHGTTCYSKRNAETLSCGDNMNDGVDKAVENESRKKLETKPKQLTSIKHFKLRSINTPKNKREANRASDIQERTSDDDIDSNNEKYTSDVNIIDTHIKKKRARSEISVFKCNHSNCFVEFTSKKLFRLHAAEHAGKVLLSCDVCKKQFVHKPALKVHMRLHEKDLEKEDTSIETLTEKSEQEIALSKESGKQKKSCYKESSTPMVISHSEECEKNIGVLPQDADENDTFKCHSCDAKFQSKEDLKSHEKLHREKFSCSKCPKMFATKQGLTFHSNAHFGKKFECDICSKTYSHANTLKKHKVQHSLDTEFQCKVCERHFPIHSLYKKHMASHTREKTFTCEICGFQTHSNNILKAHVLTHGENKFKCTDCDKTFSRKAALIEHTHTHRGVKPYVCEYCAKAFAYQSALVTHLRIHTGYRPYKCESCSKTFALSHIYKRHLLTHTRERPYKCSECEKSFTQEYNRAVHMRQHSGVRPFACLVCPCTFAQRCSLNNHMKSVHDQ